MSQLPHFASSLFVAEQVAKIEWLMVSIARAKSFEKLNLQESTEEVPVACTREMILLENANPINQQSYGMYGVLSAMWNFASGSNLLSSLGIGGTMPWICRLNFHQWWLY